MSHKITTLVYSRKAGSAHRKAVLAYFADRASDDGTGIWASKKTIADEIECGRSTVVRICNDFVYEGLIFATGTRKCANGATVEYALNLAAIRALEEVKTDPKPSRSGTSPDQDPSHSGTPPVPQRDAKPSHSGTSPNRDPSRSGTPPVPQRDAKPSRSGTQTTSQPPLNQDTNVSLFQNDVSKHFEDFWEAYPHRDGKKTKRPDAEKAFRKAISGGATVRQIALGVEALHRDPDVARGYGRGPVPWLNQQGWTDEIPEIPKSNTTTGGHHGSRNSGAGERIQRIISAAAEGSSGQDWG